MDKRHVATSIGVITTLAGILGFTVGKSIYDGIKNNRNLVQVTVPQIIWDNCFGYISFIPKKGSSKVISPFITKNLALTEVISISLVPSDFDIIVQYKIPKSILNPKEKDNSLYTLKEISKYPNNCIYNRTNASLGVFCSIYKGFISDVRIELETVQLWEQLRIDFKTQLISTVSPNIGWDKWVLLQPGIILYLKEGQLSIPEVSFSQKLLSLDSSHKNLFPFPNDCVSSNLTEIVYIPMEYKSGYALVIKYLATSSQSSVVLPIINKNNKQIKIEANLSNTDNVLNNSTSHSDIPLVNSLIDSTSDADIQITDFEDIHFD